MKIDELKLAKLKSTCRIPILWYKRLKIKGHLKNQKHENQMAIES
jgi:hypothetical protein